MVVTPCGGYTPGFLSEKEFYAEKETVKWGDAIHKRISKSKALSSCGIIELVAVSPAP